jgi:CheY-like chemotaxis protein
VPATQIGSPFSTAEIQRQGEGLPAGRILVVDDNTDAADTLAELLRMVGYEAQCAHDAREAIDMLPTWSPQLALLDIGLPEIDGYELAAMIRAQPQGQRLKLVALTGYGRDNDRTRALHGGFDEHLVKPVAIDRLMEVLARLLAA